MIEKFKKIQREESIKGDTPGTGSLASCTKEQLLSAVQVT